MAKNNFIQTIFGMKIAGINKEYLIINLEEKSLTYENFRKVLKFAEEQKVKKFIFYNGDERLITIY